MPKGPRGEKRPATTTGQAIATGGVEHERELSSAAAELGRKGGRVRAAKLCPEERSRIAKAAAAKRWAKP